MSSRSRVFVVAGVLLPLAVLVGLAAGAVLAEEFDELTPAAAAAVKRLFPDATVMGVGQEREQGVEYYEVVVRDGGKRIEVEVTGDGAVGEIESVVTLAAVPQAAREAILRETGGAPVKSVERHEVRGIPRDGTFAPVHPPQVLFEVEYADAGRRHELVVAEDGTRPAYGEEEDDDDDPEEDDDD